MASPLHFVINPQSAGGRTRERWPKYESALKEAGFYCRTYFTRGPGHATEITRGLLKAGAPGVVSVGGDGTNNEIINGFFEEEDRMQPVHGEGGGGEAPTFAIVSMGTGGDLAKTLGAPRTIEETVRFFRSAKPAPLDIGRLRCIDLRDREAVYYFVNIADFGIGGDVVTRVNSSTKVLGGRLTFLIHSFMAMLFYKNPSIRLRFDDGPIEEHVVQNVVVANGRYFGGGMKVAPEAEADDGLFDVVIFGDFERLEALLNSGRIYSGSHLTHSKVIFRRAKRLTAESAEPVFIDMDGEQPGRLPAQFEVVRGAVRALRIP